MASSRVDVPPLRRIGLPTHRRCLDDPRAGFATYLRSLFVDRVALPSFGFNVGIEAGQIVVLLGAAVLLTGLDRALAVIRWPRSVPAPLRTRVIGISVLVTLVAAKWAIERRPW